MEQRFASYAADQDADNTGGDAVREALAVGSRPSAARVLGSPLHQRARLCERRQRDRVVVDVVSARHPRHPKLQERILKLAQPVAQLSSSTLLFGHVLASLRNDGLGGHGVSSPAYWWRRWLPRAYVCSP